MGKTSGGELFVEENDERVAPVPRPVRVAPRPASCKKFALARFAEELPAIMTVLTVKAKKGSVPHVRALLDVTGLHKKELPKAAGKRRGKSLEAILREQWRKDDEEEAARVAAREAKLAAQAELEALDEVQHATQPSGGDSGR